MDDNAEFEAWWKTMAHIEKLAEENQILKYILFDLIQYMEGTPDETGLLQMVDHCYIECAEIKDLIKKAKLLLKEK